MKMMKAGLLCIALCATVASPAQAQMTWTDKGFVNLNLGAQSGSDTIATTSSFPLYDETATVATSQKVSGGGFFDLSGGYKVWSNLAVAVGYSKTSNKDGATIAASIPDPVFYDRPRTVAAAAADLQHSESVVHLMGVWMVPVTDKIDVGISFGPSIFNVKQELPTTLTIAEPGPTVTGVAISEAKETGVGFNFGVDVSYMVTKRFGAGLLARYTGGSVDLAGATDSLKVGGFQIGVGLRARF